MAGPLAPPPVAAPPGAPAAWPRMSWYARQRWYQSRAADLRKSQREASQRPPQPRQRGVPLTDALPMVLEVIHYYHGNLHLTSERLGIDRKTICGIVDREREYITRRTHDRIYMGWRWVRRHTSPDQQ